MTAASSSDFKQTGNFTIEAWFKTSCSCYQHIAAVYDGNNASFYGWDLYMTNTGHFWFQTARNTGSTVGTDWQKVVSTNAWNDGNWHHVAAVYNGSTLQIFVDGTNDGSVSWSNSASYPSTIYPTIGASANQPSHSEFWNGSLDDIRIWSTARTSDQINADKDIRLTGAEQGLAVYYPMETYIPDITYYNKNDGTDFYRSVAPFLAGVETQSLNPTGTVTMNITSSTGYGDSGFDIYEGIIANLPDFTIDGAGDDYSTNIWLDTGNDNDFFAWNGSNIYTGLNSDTYALNSNSSNGGLAVSGSTSFYLQSDGQNHSLSDLRAGNVTGIPSNTKVAVWVGVNTGSGSKSTTINSVSGL